MGLSDDVESDGDIRFLIRLRIFDKILGYIIYRIFSTKMAFSICYAQSFAMSSKRAWMTHILSGFGGVRRTESEPIKKLVYAFLQK